jgi:hypothetical protein
MGSMSASDAAPLPRLGEVFFDVRGNSRSMRLSWYADTGVAVLSIWQGGMCTGTFRLAIGDLPRLVDTLQRGPAGRQAGWDSQASGQAPADPLMESTAQVQSMEPLPGQRPPDLSAEPDYLTGVREYPDHRAGSPEYLAEPPDPRAMPPEYRTEPPDHRAASLDYQAGPLDYQPEPPDHRTGPPDYQPAPPDHRTESLDYQPGPPDHRTGPPDYQPGPPDHRTRPPGYQPGPPEYGAGAADFQAAPPDHRSGPPGYQAAPPEYEAGPAAYQPGPPDHRAGPADFQAGPPDHRTGPPGYQAAPPEYGAGPADFQPGPRDHRAGPADYQPGPPDHRAGPPDRHAVSPRPRGEYLADLAPAADSADPADYGSAIYVGGRRPGAPDLDTSGNAAYPHDTGGQVNYRREPAGDLYPGADPLDYHGEPSMPHYPPGTSAPTRSDGLGRSPADYPANYGTAVTDDIGHEPRQDSFPYGRPAGSRGARTRHADPDA